MSNLREYVNRFFDELEVFEDVSRGHNYKVYIHQAVLEFLDNETKKTALAVYDAFFDSYRINLAGKCDNAFIDLLDILHSYEENAATLIEKQRDHYVHSVNVFILGLCIYIQNANYETAFNTKILDKTDYPYSYDTKHEEFFYRWGIASLFHDVGYPIEIIGKQINEFIDFTTQVDSKVDINSHLEFDSFENLNTITEVIPKREFIQSYYEKYDSCVYVDLLKPIDLLAHRLHITLGVNLKDIKAHLDNFVKFMAECGYIDHGFYSALVVLRWYGFLIQSCKYKSEYFFYPVLDSASAILLHNYYQNVIMKPPFNRGRLSPHEHPIAYLLILCDELQEWNREAYGMLSKKQIQAWEASIIITDKRLDVTYLTKMGKLPEQFSDGKESLLSKLLEMDAVFNGGFSIGCETMSKLALLSSEINKDTSVLPRPFLDNLEELAIAIHQLYNKVQLERYPDKPLAYPRFSDLPDTLKYSNLRQARNIANKLELMGWEMRPQGSDGKVIEKIPEDTVEILAMLEHDEWVRERLNSGWVYGKVKDTEKKISPYLVPYEQLSEEIKDNDRDAIRNIPDLLKMQGLAIYEKNVAGSPGE